MKSLLIKLNKASLLWRRNGFWEGSKVILNYIGVYLRSFWVSSGDVLFISSGVGNSAYYRTHNPAEELRLHGFKTAITISDNPNLPKMATKFKVFIFHRTNNNHFVQQLIKNIKKQKKEIIFDTDDLVYDPQFLTQMDYFQKMSLEEQELYKEGIGATILNDSYVTVATTTVSFLAEKLNQRVKKVFIVPNRLSNQEITLTERLLGKEKRKDGYIRLGYFSGTLSHNKDFATITPALIKIMEDYPKVILYLAGPLDIDNQLRKYQNRIEVKPFVSRRKYYSNIKEVDVNLIPLEINNPFCESKSALKFIEAGILKIPSIATNNQTFSETIKDGVDGFLVSNEQEWVNKISLLVEDEELRKNMGKQARKKIIAQYTNKNSQNSEYYEYLRSKC